MKYKYPAVEQQAKTILKFTGHCRYLIPNGAFENAFLLYFRKTFFGVFCQILFKKSVVF